MQLISLRKVQYSRLDLGEHTAEPADSHPEDSKIVPLWYPVTADSTASQEATPPCNPVIGLSPFDQLPHQLLDTVLDNLQPDTLLVASQVCRLWQRVTQQDQYKCRRLAWHYKSFVQPGAVATFRAKRRVLSCTAERRLAELTDRVGKTMLLQT